MAGTAPDYDNERWGGPSGLRIPQEVGKATLLVKGFKAIDRGSGSGTATLNLTPFLQDTLGGAEASVIEVDNANSGTGATVLVLPGAFPGHFYAVVNKTGQTETVTLKVTGQTGIAVADGHTALLYCNATDVHRVSADIANA